MCCFIGFGRVPLALFIAKFAACRFDEEILLYIYSYFENRKKHVKISNVNNNLKTIVSAVPGSSTDSLVLFNIFFNNIAVHNFLDDNTELLPSFAKTTNNLLWISDFKSDYTTNWFRKSMIVNPDKFQETLLDKTNFTLYLNKNITTNKLWLFRMWKCQGFIMIMN